ncbi:hypothetical protein COT97_05035 [Candidatus Falkowbacteria bacterium CG10_big_fil_rev_8_21_14_0_10_39_11]|uniref:Uncharacterized protein n=1 Tax=Candidatus Falkowbacteria bacterium CG10_big_fil_rev_8_21_14_0_10_39_11 TaxID=1974565 RepID=A0A2H0V3Q3_9BACT|nr:MAG: hypothetical protein COT97_05035 [Candidatus Falkowbacteria bacterium CG10_big_fil_rev_8_21_14_0_10_39_11]
MEVILLCSPQGLIVARSDNRVPDGYDKVVEDDYFEVARIQIKHEGRLRSDNPDLQHLLREAFVNGVEFAHANPGITPKIRL